MNSTSLEASVESRLSRLGEAIAKLFDHPKHAIVLSDPLRRCEREHLLDEGDVDFRAHDGQRTTGAAISTSTTTARCENCGAPMVVKRGRFGSFLTCSRYPDCKTTKPISLGVWCPREGCGGFRSPGLAGGS